MVFYCAPGASDELVHETNYYGIGLVVYAFSIAIGAYSYCNEITLSANMKLSFVVRTLVFASFLVF